MDKEFILTDSMKAFFLDNVEKFVDFVNQVLHDEEFLRCVDDLLPFDGAAHASMNIIPEKQLIKKMGVMIVRMDLEPSLFSLAVTITIDKDGEGLQGFSIFLTACKTIEELQEYVSEEQFREEVIEQFINRNIYDTMM